jgi:hypothetical protein
VAPIDWHHHPLAGIAFPPSIGGFVRGEVHQYDDWGHDLSAAYHWSAGGSDTKLTFYVYPAGAGTDADHMQRALADIYQVHANAQVLDHARAIVNGLDGLRVDLLVPGDEAGAGPVGPVGLVPTSVLMFEADGWIVKVRATASSSSPQVACGVSVENLARHLGVPQARRRLDAGLRTAAAKAEASMAELRRADADGLMRTAFDSLEAGEFLDATEQCLAMEEAGHAGAPVVARALRTWAPVAVTFTGGVGASPLAPVVVSHARTDGERVAACYSYLESVLGSREGGWAVERCVVLLVRDALVNGISISGPGAERLWVFFKIEDRAVETPVSGITEIGNVDLTAPDGHASISVADRVPKEMATRLALHLATHHAHSLLRGRA